MRNRPSMLRQAQHSGQAIPVTEASVEIGLDGRLRVHYREVPGGRDRSEPPSRGEFIAALAKYRHRRMTPEQHRAVLEALAACGPVASRPMAQGDGSASQDDTSRAGKLTLSRPRRHFAAAR